MNDKATLTVSLSGGAGSGKQLACEALFTFLTQMGVECQIQNRIDQAVLDNKEMSAALQILSENVSVLLVDYR